MPLMITTIYCLMTEFLDALGHKDDPRRKLDTAQILTVALVAAYFFHSNHKLALDFLCSHGYIPTFSASRFSRRLHDLNEGLLQSVFDLMAQIHIKANESGLFLVDCCPMPVCHNIRAQRSKIYPDKIYHGRCESKKQYYHGLKLCLIVTENGRPVEIVLEPAHTADVTILKRMDIELPQGSDLIGDKGFLDRGFESILSETSGIRLLVERRRNMKEQLDGCLAYLCQFYRHRVETTFSRLANILPRRLHAVTAAGFEIKVFLCVLSLSILN